MLSSVYQPILVFGPSARTKLTREQRNIVLALTHETTRTTNSRREDEAYLVTGGKRKTILLAVLI